jgi:hypothetical protein
MRFSASDRLKTKLFPPTAAERVKSGAVSPSFRAAIRRRKVKRMEMRQTAAVSAFAPCSTQDFDMGEEKREIDRPRDELLPLPGQKA